MKSIVAHAKEKEKKYDWVKAADLYEQASDIVGKRDFLKRGEVQERIGYCFYRAAFQAETNEDFKKRIQMAVEAYDQAAEFFKNVESLEKPAKTSHCKAIIAFVNSWLATDSSGKRELLDECLRLGKEALKLYEEAKDPMNIGKICNILMMCISFNRLDLEWDAESREKMVGEALECGEKAIKIFSKAQDRHELAEACTLIVYLYANAAFARGFKAERREECRKKALSYAEKAIEISEETGDAYLIGLSNFMLALARMDILGSAGLQERQSIKKALQCGALARDHFLIAAALWLLELPTNFDAITQEDPDKAREEYRKLDEYREDVVRHYNIIGRDVGTAAGYGWGIVTIEDRSALETDLKNKRLLIEEAIKLGYKGLEHARLSDSIGLAFHMTRVLSRPLVCLARIETDTRRKRSLLEESSEYIEESISILEQASACADIEPREPNLAGCIWTLALNQAELANMEETIDEKTKMLTNAIANMRRSGECWLKWAESPWAHVEKPHWFLQGKRAMTLGKTLSQLYALANDVNILGEMIEAFEKSVDSYVKADSIFSRVAENYWELAKVYNKMGNYTESARNFELASENYLHAAKKIPQLKDFYKDHALYMQAWSEIEEAKRHHAENRYGEAKEHYERAANIHKSTRQWNHLSPNYLAWARLEEAEDLSRREQTEEARHLFQQAANLFAEAKKSTQVKLEKIETEEEKEMLVNLTKASNIRREYCLGRIALEEAKILDRKGDHAASSRKYGSAIEKFQKATDNMEDELDRQELKLIVCLCQAWQMMTRAEAEASPNLYKEASKLFEEAIDHSLNEKAKMLALGHSRFCMALEAGTRFEDIRNATLHTLATQHLESAGGYYLRAGFKNASEYAEATQKLLDAYLYMHNAKIETDPPKKARFYMMAEKVLQASAGSYLKAKHPAKQEQVSRLLEKVRKERELALSLTEVLHAPLATSTTATFTTPTPTEETPVGLERFEHADIQANLIVRVKEVNVGKDVKFRMELVNAGKAPALLIKVDEIAPEGFEIREVPEIYTVEDNYLNMKGKRLNPLKTEDVRIVLKPLTQGTYTMKPRILYIDETGKYKSHEPEPVTITVKELGIKGWIKGER